MRKYLLIFLLGFVIKGYSQKPFSNIDFNSGDYSLLVINDREPVYGWKRDSIGRLLKIDSTTHFFSNEKSFLKNLKTKWNLISTDTISICGFDYKLYLIKGDSLLSTYRYNVDCAELSDNSAYFKLEPEQFFFVISSFEKFERKEPDYLLFRKSQTEFEENKLNFLHYFEKNFLKKPTK